MIYENLWKKYIKPTKLIGNLYFVGNHVQNNNTDKKIDMLNSSERNPFIVPDEGEKFLLERKERKFQIIKNNE